MTQRAGRRLTSLTLGLVCLAAATGAHAKSQLLTGTIILGVPRSDFVVVGADRLWTNALAKPGDPPWERQGPQRKIALHPSLPLAIATAGLATLDAEQDTVSYIRELITFYRSGAFASAAKLFGYAITDRAGLVEHVRHVIEAGIREEARLHQGQNRQVGGPVDVVLVDAKGARCVPACPPP